MIQLQEQTTCKYCVYDDVNFCENYNNQGYGCSRNKGHEGDHVACGYDEGHVLAMWPQEIKA